MMTESDILLREGTKIVEALGKTLAPLVEVVLHDLTRPEHGIVAISNNLSGRQVGDPTTEIGLARMSDPGYPDVLQNYANRFPDGRPAKSTSIGLRNGEGRYVAAICLNVDTGMLGAMATCLQQLAETSAAVVHETLAPPRIDALRGALEQFAAARNTTPRGLSALQRRQAVLELADKGLMELKNSHGMVADMLGIARSTVYSYLPKERIRV
jgi:predicted transcriptional regulator YheO